MNAWLPVTLNKHTNSCNILIKQKKKHRMFVMATTIVCEALRHGQILYLQLYRYLIYILENKKQIVPGMKVDTAKEII